MVDTPVKEGIRSIPRVDSTKYNPQLQTLERIDLLSRGDNDALTDLGDAEIIAFALVRALDSKFKMIVDVEGSDVVLGGLPMTKSLIDNMRSLRISRQRLGRSELVRAIRPVNITHENYMPIEEEEKREGFFSKIVSRIRGR
jgi:hypothetical protein